MSTKPSAPATWDSNSTNLIAPTSGHKTDGYAIDEVPSSTEINGQLKLIGDWTKYIDDGDIELHDVDITGTLEVEGKTTLDGPVVYTAITADYTFNTDQNPLDPLGSGTVNTLRTIYLEALVDYPIIHGIASTGVPVGQQLILYNDGPRPIYVRQSSTSAGPTETIFFPSFIAAYGPRDVDIILTAAGAIVLERAANDEWNVVSMSGCRVSVPLIIPGSLIVDVNGSHSRLNSALPASIGWLCGASTNPFTVPITGLVAGDYISAYSVLIDKASGGTGVWSTKLYTYEAGTGPTEATASAGYSTSAAAPGLVGLGESSLNVATVYTKQYYIWLDPTAACSGDSIYHAVVWITRAV